MGELTGILKGTGAKMKADVPFSEITPEVRGTLLVLSCRGQVVEVAAGSNAQKLASRIRKGMA